MTVEMIEVRALKPFTGSYICDLADADYVSEEWVQDPATGNLVKRAIPRKRFFGEVPVERWLTSLEVEMLETGRGLPTHIEIIVPAGGLPKTKNGRLVADIRAIEHPSEPIVRLPADTGADLIRRGLAAPYVPEEQAPNG